MAEFAGLQAGENVQRPKAAWICLEPLDSWVSPRASYFRRVLPSIIRRSLEYGSTGNPAVMGSFLGPVLWCLCDLLADVLPADQVDHFWLCCSNTSTLGMDIPARHPPSTGESSLLHCSCLFLAGLLDATPCALYGLATRYPSSLDMLFEIVFSRHVSLVHVLTNTMCTVGSTTLTTSSFPRV